MIFFALLYFAAAIVYLYMGVFTISNNHHKKINRIYLVISLIMFIWSIISLLVILSPTAEIATNFRQCAIFAWGLLYSVLLHFFIILTGRNRYFKNPISFLILYSPAVYSIYLYFFQKPETVDSITRNSLGWIYLSLPNQGWVWDYFLTLYYLTYLIISIILLWTWGRESLIKREKRQSQIMISTLIITIILGSITDIILPKTDFILLPPLAVVLCLIPIGGIWYAMIKYKLMNLNYESLMLDILKVIDDGIIIINHEGIIVEVNQGTLILLGYPNKRKLVNEHFKIIFKEGIDLSSISKLNNKEMEVRTSDNKYLPVLLQYQTIKDQLNDNLGSLIIFQDISELKKVQKALEKTRDNLEEKVLERTGELSKINFELKNEIKARIIVENEISKSAFCDSLTNLPNRRLFNDRLEQAILKASRNKDHLVLLYIDIDSFKHVNDTLGHIKGDRLLVEISIRLKNCLRKTDTIARVGGDEFLIILQDIKEDSDTLKITENILNCFKLPFRIDEQELKVTSSIGASIYPTDGLDFEALVKNADAAMYKAKESGRNKIEFCTFEMKEKRNETIMLTNSLYYAIERNEFELYYQPQVDARTNVICGVEALLRWHHPELGMVSPSIFIPIAENSGLIMAIGDWVLREACKQNKIWQDKGLLRIPVAVNVSIKQFSNSVITKSVREILKETGLSPDSLELEITEGIVMGDTETLIATLLELKEIGVQLAVDDFGTEYASLSYLKHLPIDRIKIAMTFIRGININIKDEIITQAIILLAQNLGMAVIAEGVEKREQLDFLQNSGCDMIQGFYYYKPMPKEELEKLLS